MFEISKYTIGWVCALQTELVAATEFLDEEHDSTDYQAEPNDNNTYIFGSIGKHNIVIATLPRGEYGTSSSAGVARDMIRSFTNIRIGLMVGIGGAAPLMEPGEKKRQDIRLGDVIVSIPSDERGGVLQYDHGKTIQGQEFQITGHLNSPPQSLLTAVSVLGMEFLRKGNGLSEDVSAAVEKNRRIRKMYQRPEEATDRLYKSSFVHADVNENCSAICLQADQLIHRELRSEDDEDIVMVHDGLIASGNQLMKDALVRNDLARKSNVLCFEMEAAGLTNQLPFLVVRGICDYSDTHKNKAWQGYAAMTAAAYTRKLLLRLAPHKVQSEMKFSELKEIKENITEVNANIVSIQAGLIQDSIDIGLAAPDPGINFRLAQDAREPGTGSWLFESDFYLKWKCGSIKRLWLHGKAGCGKSVISATVIEDIQNYCSIHSDTGCAFFYFTFSDGRKQSYVDCLRSILQQISGNRVVSSALEKLYGPRKETTSRKYRVEESLQDILLDGIRSYKTFFLVLDGLDEIPGTVSANVNQREKALAWIRDIANIPNLQILATSRWLLDINDHMVDMAFEAESMVIGCINVDISKWVASQMSQDRRLRDLDASLNKEVQDVFMQKADGMFRWAYCQMTELRNLQSTQPTDFRRALRNLPSTLDETYDRMICSIHPGLHEKASNLLRWLAYSCRPLNLLELSETRIISLDGDEGSVDIYDRGDPEDVLRMLSGLVVTAEQVDIANTGKDLQRIKIDDEGIDSDCKKQMENRIVRLAHFSVQEYLESLRKSEKRPSHFYFVPNREHQFLAHCCLAYLTSYAEGGSKAKAVKDLTALPLLEYAASSWYKHCQDTNDVDREFRFLSYQARIDDWINIHKIERPWYAPFDAMETVNANGLYYSAFIGLKSLVNAFLQAKFDVSAQGGDYGNALQAASIMEHNSIVQILLDAGADVNAQGGYHGNALQAASEKGHDSTVQILLDAGADVNAQGGYHGNALQAASVNGHDSTVNILVGAGADVNAQGGYCDNALQAASAMGHASIVKTLIDAGADVNAPNVLHATSLTGRTSIIKMLIDAGADVNSQGGQYGNALLAASVQQHGPTVEILLAAGADVNAQSESYSNALQAATSCLWDAMAKVVREFGRTINPEGGDYGNMVQPASIGDYDSLIKTLIDAGADVNAQGGYNGNALQEASACAGEYPSMAKLLIDAGADVNAQGGYHGNALHAACVNGNDTIVKILIDAGANLNQTGRYGSALSAAAYYGLQDICEILLNCGVDLSVSDYEGRTAAHYAAVGGRVELLNRLIEFDHGCLSHKDMHGKTVLDYACLSGSTETIEIVLRMAGSNFCNSSIINSWSAWHWAMRGGSFECLEILTEKNIRSHAVETQQPSRSWTAWDIAIYHDNRNLIDEKGAKDQRYDWSRIIGTETKRRPEDNESTNMNLICQPPLQPARKAFDGSCKGCLMDIYGDRFCCQTCPDLDYCFMCKHESEKLHAGHDWKWIKASDDSST